MSIKQFIFNKGQFAGWLLTVTLVFALFALSRPAAITSQSPRKTATEIIHSGRKTTLNKTLGYHYASLPLAVDTRRPTPDTRNIVLAHGCLVHTRFTHLARQFMAIWQVIQAPCVNCIFRHSDQEPATA